MENFSFKPAFRSLNARESRLEEIKKTKRTIAQGIPPSPQIIHPTTAAVIAPDTFKAFKRQAILAMPTPKIKPVKNYICRWITYLYPVDKLLATVEN